MLALAPATRHAHVLFNALLIASYLPLADGRRVKINPAQLKDAIKKVAEHIAVGTVAHAAYEGAIHLTHLAGKKIHEFGEGLQQKQEEAQRKADEKWSALSGRIAQTKEKHPFPQPAKNILEHFEQRNAAAAWARNPQYENVLQHFERLNAEPAAGAKNPNFAAPGHAAPEGHPRTAAQAFMNSMNYNHLGNRHGIQYSDHYSSAIRSGGCNHQGAGHHSGSSCKSGSNKGGGACHA